MNSSQTPTSNDRLDHQTLFCFEEKNMIFAIRRSGHHQTLVEFPDRLTFEAALKDKATGIDRQMSIEAAFRWVKDGREHETGLYWMDHEIAYAGPDNDA